MRFLSKRSFFSLKELSKDDTKHQGKYPVIFLTFKDVKFDSWETTIDKIRALLQAEFGRHLELQESKKLAGYEKVYFARMIDGSATEVDLTSALENLSRMLARNLKI